MQCLATCLFFVLLVYNANALRCYTCVTGEASEDDGDGDQRCVTNPSQVQTGQAITNCNKKYCTSQRREYKEPMGKLQSMHRDCADKPTFFNEVIEDNTHRTYFRACQEDLCNGGDGKDISSGNNNNNGAIQHVLIVPGRGNGSSLRQPVMLITVLCAIIAKITV